MPTTADRVCELTATTGIGSLTLAGAVAGYQSFAAGVGNGVPVYYTIEAIGPDGLATGDFEVGTGTLSNGSTLSRDAVLVSSNGGSLVSLAAGSKRVFAALPAELVARFALLDAANTFTAAGSVVQADATTFPLWKLVDTAASPTGATVAIAQRKPASVAFTIYSLDDGGNVFAGGTVTAAGFTTVGTAAVQTLTASAVVQVVAGGKTLATSGTNKLTTSDTSLTLEVTGDTLGTVQMILENRSGQAGPLFKSLSLNVLDFSFQGSSTGPLGLRFEGRGAGFVYGDAVQLQLGTAGSPTLVAGTSAAGFAQANSGSAVTAGFWNNSDTTVGRQQASLVTTWTTATDASRKARAVLSVYDTAAREVMRGEADGSNPRVGFLGAAAVARPTVTGSKGANAALASLMTALANLGLVTDSTT